MLHLSAYHVPGTALKATPAPKTGASKTQVCLAEQHSWTPGACHRRHSGKS